MGSNARASRSRWPTSSRIVRASRRVRHRLPSRAASLRRTPRTWRSSSEVRESCDLKHAQIAAFGSTCKKGVAAADDPGLADLIACGAPVVTIVGKTWDAQVDARAANDARREPAHDRRVGGALEGGWPRMWCSMPSTTSTASKRTATMPSPAWSAAVEAGADSVDLCETNGGALPFEVERDRRGHRALPSRARPSASTATTTPVARWPTRSRPCAPAPRRCRAP